MNKIYSNGKQIISNIKKVLLLVFNVSPFFTFWMFFSSIIKGIFPILQIYISKNIIDLVVLIIKNGFTEQEISNAIFWVILELSVTVLNMCINYYNNYLYSIYSAKVSNYIKIKIYTKSITLDMSYFDDDDFYNKMNRAVNQSGDRPIKIIQTIFNEFQIIITFIGLISIFTVFSPFTLIIIIACTLPVIYAETKYSKKLYTIYKNRINEKRMEGYWGFLLTDQTSIKEILIFRLGNHLISSIKEKMNNFLIVDKKFQKESNIVKSVLQLLSILSFYFFYGYYVIQAATSKITLGDLNMLISAIRRTQEILKSFLINLSILYESDLYIKDLFLFDEITPKINQNSTLGLNINKIKKIEFRNLSFTYPNEEKSVLKNINFIINNEEKVALVGRNGSGKSTIIKLLLRLYNPTNGNIFLNDVEIDKYNLSDIRKCIGVIFQDYLQYQISVKDNIGYGNIDNISDLKKIKKAAYKGKSNDFIMDLPNKFDSKLGKLYADMGSELSKGQWQRIALSRAFMNEDASVYILDEPTSSLDIETEYEIYSDFQKMIGNRTCLLVSHRLSTIKKVDRILVLKNGEIVENGNHETLIKNGFEYSEINKLAAILYN